MTLYFDDGASRRVIGAPDTFAAASRLIASFLEERRYKSYYTRMWHSAENPCAVHFDVGSHTQFFILEDTQPIQLPQ